MINSGKYFESIIEHLNILREEISSKSRLGLTDLNKHCENFLKEILNRVHDLNLENLNDTRLNYPGLDLGDKIKKTAYQVTATKTSEKIDSTLKKCIDEQHYKDFENIFVFILTKKQKSYSLNVLTGPYFRFSVATHVFDFDDLYQDISQLSLEKKKGLAEYISRELPYSLTGLKNLPGEAGITAPAIADLLNAYLQKTITANNNILLDNRYVNIYGQPNIDMNIGGIGMEVINDDFNFTHFRSEYSFLDYPDPQQETTEEDEEDSEEQQPRIDTIVNIAKDTQRFIIIGEPGSGKTTSLKKILYQNARDIQENHAPEQVPVFLSAINYGRPETPTWTAMIAYELKAPESDVISLLKTGRLQLLIDGINETDISLRHKADNDIQNIVNEYDSISVILSARKFGFKKNLPVPVFELKELQDNEIQEFIYKHNPDKSDALWEELKNNLQLMHLAHNPLMLFMILGASKSGEIPRSKGDLYHFFVMHLLYEEFKKLNDARKANYKNTAAYTTERVDILSFIAFEMKQLGKVSISHSSFTDLITSVNDLSVYHDLLDSPLLSGTDDISFFHESFLDFFCALAVKKRAESGSDLRKPLSLQDIGITDITDNRWYEPLLMCGDLLGRKNGKEEHAKSYLELLSKGEINTVKPAKRLTTAKISEEADAFTTQVDDIPFNSQDLNEDLLIACKVAYNFKTVYPSLYNNLENTLANYLLLWRLSYRKSIMLFPLNKLLAAVAALSSPQLFKTILFNPNWQEIWLYSPTDEKTNTSAEFNLLCIDYNNELLTSFINNVSDFDILFNLLNNESHRITNTFFKSISTRIRNIRTSLLLNSAINDLKKSFLNNRENLQLLAHIGSTDIDFYITHYNASLWSKKKFVSFLLSKLTMPAARAELLKLLGSTDLVPEIRKKIIHAFLSSYFFTEIFPYIENELKKNSFLRSSILEELWNVRFNDLTPFLQEFVRNNAITESITSIRCSYQIRKITRRVSKYAIIAPRLVLDLHDMDYEMFMSMKYRKAVRLNGTDDCIVRSFALRKNGKLSDTVSWSQVKDSSDLSGFSCELVVSFVGDSDIANVPERGALTAESEIDAANIPISDFRMFETIHPDLLEQNEQFMKEFLRRLKMSENQRYRYLAMEFNWVHKFHELLDDVSYGIVIKKFNQVVHIFRLDQKTVAAKQNIRDKIREEDIVVFEKRGSIHVISDERQEKIGYIQSYVSRVDHARMEGHIYKKDKQEGEKDYYFHFTDCDTNVIKGDIVSFLPAINTSLKSYGLPKAYKVKKEKNVEKCRIKTINYNKQKGMIYGEAFDLLTNEVVWYSLYVDTAKQKPKKYTVKANQLYSYKCFNEDSSPRKVKLLEIVKK